MNKIDAIIQNRLGSTRLNRKALLDLGGKKVYQHIIDICRACSLVDRIILAVPESGEDIEFFSRVAEDNDILFFAGSQNNVLARFYHAAVRFRSNHILRVTADDPLKDPGIVDKVIGKYLDSYPEFDYVSNTIKPTYPEGLDCEVLKFSALEKAFIEADKKIYTEHVTTYIWMNPDKFKTFNVTNDIDYSNLRWTLDNERDYEFFKQIFERLYNGHPIPWDRVLALLDREPELKNINSGTERYAGLNKTKLESEE